MQMLGKNGFVLAQGCYGHAQLAVGWIMVRRCCRSVAVVLAAALIAIATFAQTVTDLPNLKQTHWSADAGAPSEILAIAQTPDGFLWLAAKTGLYRFDGVSFTRMPEVEGKYQHSTSITRLLVDRSGTLWIGYAYGGLATYREGRISDANVDRPSGVVTGIVQTRDGAIWVSAQGLERANLRRYAHGKWKSMREGWGLPQENLRALLAARDGSLLVSSLTAVLRLQPGEKQFHIIKRSSAAIRVAEDGDGKLWAASGGRIAPLDSAKRGDVTYAQDAFGDLPTAMVFDGRGKAWLADSVYGLFTVELDGPPRSRSADRRPNVARAAQVAGVKQPTALFTDREGTLWMASLEGLTSLRVTSAVKQDVPPPGSPGYVFVKDGSGSVYLLTRSQLVSLDTTKPAIRLMAADWQAGCAAAGHGVWIADAKRMFRRGGASDRSIALPPGALLNSCAEDARGRLLISTTSGTYQLVNDSWRQQAIVPGKPQVWAHAVSTSRRGGFLMVFGFNGVWHVTDRGAVRLIDTDFKPFGYPRDIIEGKTGMIVVAEGGLVRLRGGRVQYLPASTYPFLTGIGGYHETADGRSWIAGDAGLFHLPTSDLDRAFDNAGFPLAPVPIPVNVQISSLGGTSYVGNVLAEDRRGRLWLLSREGPRVIDPSLIQSNSLAPSVLITKLSSADRSYADPQSVELGKGVENITIDYTATSLAEPLRVRFRYQLEGVDRGWVDPGTRRQAFYTNLRPGRYRFRVIAANNDGVWNKRGASLDFTIEPTFVQSGWFLLMCGVCVALMLWAVYSIRTRQLTTRVRDRLEGQLVERERIARELHDTLLQGFQGLLLRFQSVANRMAPSSELRAPLDQALERGEAVLIEGRRRVTDLRFVQDGPYLSDRLARLARELTAGEPVEIDITVEGTVREVEPMAGEELLRIAEEAICNALRHAQASRIQVGMSYGAAELQLGVADNGQGLPDEVATAGGRDGHYGLLGMRERAERAGGRLTLVSRSGQGTEVRIALPARLAYRRREAKPHHPLILEEAAA